MIKLLPLSVFVFLGCSQSNSSKETGKDESSDKVKQELISLERKWLDAEFALDTAYISTLLDGSFIDISEEIHNKQQALKGMYDGINARRKDSLVLDSLKFEDVVMNLYDNTAVIALITHSYSHKPDGSKLEIRKRFYDVWINRNGKWKAVSSQGTALNGNSSN
jgi:hypothetical protein